MRGRRGYQRSGGLSLMKMLEDGQRAKRFERYSDEDLEATVQQVSSLDLTPFERACLADIDAELARRKAITNA